MQKEDTVIMNRETSKQAPKALAACALALLLLAGTALPAGAQSISRVDGEVRDMEGKLFPEVVVVFKHDETGLSNEVKTDKNGRFIQTGLRGGVYTVTFKVKDQVVYEQKLRLATGAEERLNINFKELAQQMTAEQAAARKKQEEDLKKFDSLKGRFEAGRVAMDKAKQMRSEVQRMPADQRGTLPHQVAELFQTAITEFEEAQKAATEKEPNLHLILANLGEAYEAAGRSEDAVAAYKKAIELKPTAGYYNNLGNTLATLKRLEEAGQAYQKAAELEPTNASMYWRNFGIVLYNSGQLKEAIGPLRKATELDATNADAWYLLGASLVAGMESKMEGDKIIPVVQPGTVEAFQKYLELQPDGRFANLAKENLAQLEAMGVGIQTRVRQTKKRP